MLIVKQGSRTAKLIKNGRVAVLFFCVEFILKFFSRQIFLCYLGEEILGLNSVITSLLQFLNLVELGIGSAVGFSLYEPIFKKDEQSINEIVTLQGELYRRIAYIIIAGSTILVCFFPLIFAEMSLPLWYAYASFGVMLFSALLGYFINYKLILLSADQKDFKILYTHGMMKLSKIAVQMIFIKYLDNKYVWWLVLEVAFAFAASYLLNRTIKHTYPFLSSVKTKLSFRELSDRHPTVKIKIKQVFIHKVSSFALNQITPIIIYAYTSLTLIACYDNYMLVVLGLTSLTDAVFRGLTAGIGNLVAEKAPSQKIVLLFGELFALRSIVAGAMCFGMVIMIQPFIVLWVGKDFLLPDRTMVILTCIFFVSLQRQLIDSFLNAYGFYSDVWSSIIEVIIGIGLSVLMGFIFGLNGILTGFLVSQIVIKVLWKSIYLFKIKLKYGLQEYTVTSIKYLLFNCAIFYVSHSLMKLFPINPFQGFPQLFCWGLVGITIFVTLFIVTCFFLDKGMKSLFKRVTKQ